jgi:hypothetical protein
MALITERITTQNMGLITLDVIYNNTGQQLVDHFSLHNGTDHAIIVWVDDQIQGELYRNTFPPGDHTIPPTGSISWRRATNNTTWSIGVSG